jgi:type I restriction enzyme S subunit
VPRAWAWARIGEVTSSLDYGSSAKSSETGTVPVLRMGNLQGGEIDWDDLKFTDDATEIETYRLAPNTVLFNRTNSPALVGKTALYRGGRPAVFAGYLIRVALLPGVLPQYVNVWMNSPLAREWCVRVRQDGVSQSNISAGKLASLHLPVPPLAEQYRMVARVDALMRLLHRLEERLAAARTAHTAFAAAAVHHLDA